MISTHLIQVTIDGIKSICRADICVMDVEGEVVASTFENAYEYAKDTLAFIESPAECQEVSRLQFIKVYDENEPEFVVIIKGEAENLYTVAKMTAFHIQSLIIAYKEKYDKDNYIKNLLLDNILTVDIYARAKKLHIESKTKRVVYMIETGRKETADEYNDNSELLIIRNLFASKRSRDFVTAVDEKNIILVRELRQNESESDLWETANMIMDMLNTEAMTNVRVAYGTIKEDIKDISKSYREAQMALEISGIFYDDRKVISYNDLGIGRLIYHLPEQICVMFVNEVLKGHSIDDFDDEMITTIMKFFSNNLNISETSRQLFIHRNTLVYRLDKIQRMTGLDLRVFENVVVFKVALMVSKYLKHINNKKSV